MVFIAGDFLVIVILAGFDFALSIAAVTLTAIPKIIASSMAVRTFFYTHDKTLLYNS